MSNNNFASFWQSPLWEEILSETRQAEICWHTDKGQNWLLERRTILGNMTGLYALGVDESEITPEYLASLRKIIKRTDIFLQIEPLGPSKTPEIQSPEAPFRRFIEPVTAVVLLTNQTEETLLQNFAEKGRYNIRVAERRGLTTRWVRGDDLSLFDLPGTLDTCKKTYTELFFDLLKETTERDSFSHNSLSYYQTFIRTLEQHNSGGLLLSLKDGIIHAAGIFVYHGQQAIYYYGASPNNAEIRRDNGTYLLQWEAMREALRRGCSEYDFLGISSEEGDKLAGVTAFKMRFHPEKVFLPRERVIVFKPITLKILQCMNRIRKIFR